MLGKRNMSYKERGADMGAIYSQRSATVSNHVQVQLGAAIFSLKH